jgi:hypothetical protein
LIVFFQTPVCFQDTLDWTDFIQKFRSKKITTGISSVRTMTFQWLRRLKEGEEGAEQGVRRPLFRMNELKGKTAEEVKTFSGMFVVFIFFERTL